MDHLKLVSTQNDEDIKRHELLDAIKWRSRELAANLMRVVRGAGRPDLLPQQMDECLEAFMAYQEAAGRLPKPAAIRDFLDPDLAYSEYRPWAEERTAEQQERWEADGTLDEQEAERTMRRAGLQMAASMLVDQYTQQLKAKTDLHDGVRAFNAAREKRRASCKPPAKVRGRKKPVDLG